MRKLRWGVLSTSRFAQQKVIPAMRDCCYAEVVAIASRDSQRAQEVAERLSIPLVHDSYEGLLADPSIDVVYNPLPNHLHVPLSIAALEAGKHVLCEKPVALDLADATRLYEASRRCPRLKVMEAFMYRFHPQWQRVRELVDEGRIGRLVTIHSFFSYYNDDPDNVRNRQDIGGGGLLDIGCYSISLSRFIFNAEPDRVVGVVANDPTFNVDRLTSAILDFNGRTATFTCGTRMSAYQRVHIIGEEGRIEIEIPFNQPPDSPAQVIVESKGQREVLCFEPANQYTIQGDLFSLAVINDSPVPTPIEDALANMQVIDAVFASARSGAWIPIT